VAERKRIEGRGISTHPLSPYAGRWRKVATVLAVQADEGGYVSTPEGNMTYEAGDYIVTDDPPTHAWPVRGSVFEATHVPADA
jgi:hypothetical protein